jgi:Family of unknown function (DUF6448)
MSPKRIRAARTALAAALLLLAPTRAAPHCDTLDGPVVAAARLALESGDVTPVLWWIKPEFEAAVRQQFARTLSARRQGPEAGELADRSFFETVVRLHRQGEEAPYTGLEPAGTKLDPVVAWTDQALETGSADALVRLVTQEVAAGIRSRLARTLERKKQAHDSIEAGREFVESYVEYTHYVENVYHEALGERDPGRPSPAHSH